MAEYIDRAEYCEKHCRCSNEYCDRQSCPIWKAPAADVAPVVYGRWLDGRCTVCGWEEPDEIGYDGYEFSPWEHTNYCPNCGAIMDGVE